MAAAGVELRLETQVFDIAKTESGFHVRLSSGPVECQSLVIATGGKSIPKMGATSFGYRVAEQFGIAVTETRPALVPLTFEPHMLDRLKALAGVAVDAVVSHGKVKFAKRCSSPIAACLGRQFCKFPAIGVRAMRSGLILSPDPMFFRFCAKRGRPTANRNRRQSCRTCCPKAWRSL